MTRDYTTGNGILRLRLAKPEQRIDYIYHVVRVSVLVRNGMTVNDTVTFTLGCSSVLLWDVRVTAR